MGSDFYFRLLLPCIFLLFFAGCSKEAPYDELPTPLIVGLHEVFDDNERCFSLSFSTAENYPCDNFEIISTLDNSSQGMHITFKGLHVPRICISTVGPAKGYLYIKQMQEGDFALNFLYGNKEVKTMTNISDQELLVNLNVANEEFLFFPDTKINRIPSNYIWGNLRDTGGHGLSIGDAFFQDLQASGAWDPELEDGHYGFFRISSSELFLDPYNTSQEAIDEQTFVFVWDGDFQQIQQIASAHSEAMEIEIFSALGHHYQNNSGAAKAHY